MMGKPEKALYRSLRPVGRLLIIALYLVALTFGFLCVLYHLFFIWYSSLDGDPLSLPGIMLALANMIYPVCVAVLLGSAYMSKRWGSYIFKPQVWAIVVLLMPIIFYLNYVLVESLGPYNYSL